MKTIKQSILGFGMVVLLVIGTSVLMSALNNPAKAAPAQRGGVVVLIATSDFTITPPNLVVKVSSSSRTAPLVPVNTSVAQALDDLFDSGFQIQHIEETSLGLNYTLVR